MTFNNNIQEKKWACGIENIKKLTENSNSKRIPLPLDEIETYMSVVEGGLSLFISRIPNIDVQVGFRFLSFNYHKKTYMLIDSRFSKNWK